MKNKKTTVTRKVYPQYYSNLWDDWADICNGPVRNMREAKQAIRDYRKKYTVGSKHTKFRVVDVYEATTVIEVK